MTRTSDLTSNVPPEILALHGRLRLLRGHRNREAQDLRGSIEMLHSLLLTSLRGLDTKELSKPIDSVTFRRVYRELRESERKVVEIDAEFFDVQQQLNHSV